MTGTAGSVTFPAVLVRLEGSSMRKIGSALALAVLGAVLTIPVAVATADDRSCDPNQVGDCVLPAYVNDPAKPLKTPPVVKVVAATPIIAVPRFTG
jgi:hypothetical protein